MSYKELTTKRIVFDEIGKTITGVLLGKKESGIWNENPDGTKTNVPLYSMLLDEGMPVSFFGTSVLCDILASIQSGEQIKIIYVGDVKTANKRNVKNFQIFIDDGTN